MKGGEGKASHIKLDARPEARNPAAEFHPDQATIKAD